MELPNEKKDEEEEVCQQSRKTAEGQEEGNQGQRERFFIAATKLV